MGLGGILLIWGVLMVVALLFAIPMARASKKADEDQDRHLAELEELRARRQQALEDEARQPVRRR